LFNRNLLAAAFCAAVLAAGCVDRSEPEPEDQAVRPARIFLVQGSAGAVEYKFVGRVEAAQSVDMTFEVSGPLVQLPVREGQTINKGDLVAALEAKDFELAVREAQVQLQLARQDLERKQRVLAQRGIARSVVDDARSNFELQKVRLDKAQESLADARLLAPFNAFVARRYVDNFVTVRAGEKIVRLNDPEQLLVVANIPEALFATSGDAEVIDMYAEFDFAPDAKFPLEVFEARGEADAVAQTYEVSLAMSRPQHLNVLPGMTASVIVHARDSRVDTSTLIPASALVSADDGSFVVWVFDPQTLAVERRAVTVEAPVAAGVPVTSGLVDGEMIVATGASQLSEGMKVRMLGEPSSRL